MRSAVFASGHREAVACGEDRFSRLLERHGLPAIRRSTVTTVQANLGKLCNMACQHCHVEAGPTRTEVMDRRTIDRLLDLLMEDPAVRLLDLTGGAPELNPDFRFLVSRARRLGLRVLDRCNLTVLFEPGMQDLGEFLADRDVEIVASLPCYEPANVESQRGKGAYSKSIEGLRLLNALGYGRSGSDLRLDLVYNPVGATLPPPAAALEEKYRSELARLFGIEFHRLVTITNMPISRFARQLKRSGEEDAYYRLLDDNFNPHTVAEVMCRSLLSIGWDGVLYDCDFNQMLEIGAGHSSLTLWDVESFQLLAEGPVAVADHCLGCTAG
ncbi:MAG: arsenosugar biosynthesis radical SAM (seleno)protein ArsS, partial [Candidatus Binatia bacterium]